MTAHRPASLRRSILLWLVPATAAIGILALLDTRIEALRTAREVSDRVLVGSAMAIAEGVDVAADGGLAIAIPYSALDMLSSTAQDQVFYRVDGPQGILTGYQDLVPATVPSGQEIGLADARYRSLPIRTATLVRDLTTGEGRDDSKAHASSPIGGRIAAQIEQIRVLKHRVNTRIAELAI